MWLADLVMFKTVFPFAFLGFEVCRPLCSMESGDDV
jgi:hypothetical protein